MYGEDGGGMLYQHEGTVEDEFEIKLSKDEPPFLQG